MHHCRLPSTGALRLEGGIGVLDTRRNLVRSMFLDAVADDSDEAAITNSTNKKH